MDRIEIDDLFDRRLIFPDPDARRRLDRLVGIDEARARLTNLLTVLVRPVFNRSLAARCPGERAR